MTISMEGLIATLKRCGTQNRNPDKATRVKVPTRIHCRWRESDRSVHPSRATRDSQLVANSPISNLQPAIDDGKRLAQLLFVDAQRRIGEEGIPADKGVETLLAEEAPKRRHLVRGAIERSHGLFRLAAAHQFDDAEQSDGAHRAH